MIYDITEQEEWYGKKWKGKVKGEGERNETK
jgi:hypothetical protein